MSNSTTLRRDAGFTLIELVVVIILLGILAAVALPKFVDLSTSARIAAVKAAAGAVAAGASLAGAGCLVSPGCVDDAGQGALMPGPDGVSNRMWRGYPTGQSRAGQYFGIRDWVQVEGFTAIEWTAADTDFTKDGAPDPSNCKVTYHQAAGTPAAPSYTIATSGC